MRVLIVLFAVCAVSYGAFISQNDENQNQGHALESSYDDAQNKERLIFQTVKKTTTTTSYSTTTVTTFTLCAITIVQGSGCIPYGRKRKRSAIAHSPAEEMAPVEPVIRTAPEDVPHVRVDREANPDAAVSESADKGRFFLVTSSTTTTMTTTVTTTSYSATVSATISSCSANIIPPYNACAVGK